MQGNQDSGINTPFDDTFKTLQERAPFLMIPVLNEVFGTTYNLDSEDFIQLSAEHHTAHKTLYEDSRFSLFGEKFHLECQSTNDSTIPLRVIEYDFADALQDAYTSKDWKKGYELKFAKSCILNLRGQRKQKQFRTVRLRSPDHQMLKITIPVVNVSSYNLEEILKKKLFLFLPFYFMRYEKQLRKLEDHAALMKTIEQDYQIMEMGMRQFFVGTKWEYCYALINDLTRTVWEAIIPSESLDLKERIREIMGGHSISTPTTICIDFGMALERKNTERERERADLAEQRADQATQRADQATQRVKEILKENALLKEALQKYEMQPPL